MGGNSLIYCHHIINSPFLTERVTSSGRKKADPLGRKKGRGKKPWFLPLYSDRQRTRASHGHEFFICVPKWIGGRVKNTNARRKDAQEKSVNVQILCFTKVNKFGHRRFSPVLRVRQFPLIIRTKVPIPPERS